MVLNKNVSVRLLARDQYQRVIGEIFYKPISFIPFWRKNVSLLQVCVFVLNISSIPFIFKNKNKQRFHLVMQLFIKTVNTAVCRWNNFCKHKKRLKNKGKDYGNLAKK